MGILYVDEAGNNNIREVQQPNFFYGGVYIKNNQWNDIEIKLNNIQTKYRTEILKSISSSITVTASGLMRPDDEERLLFFKNFHIHGTEIVNGKGLWGKLNKNTRLNIVEEFIDLIISNDICIFIGKLKKQDIVSNLNDDNLKEKGIEFKQLLPYFFSQFENNLHVQESVLIRASGHDHEEKITSEMLKKTQKCCPDKLIMQSKESLFLQLSDMVLWINQAYFKSIIKDDQKSKDKKIIKIYKKLEKYDKYFLIEGTPIYL